MNPPALETLEAAAAQGDPGASIALANRLLAEHPAGTPRHHEGLQRLEREATGPRAAEALWLLGAYHLQVTGTGGAHARARRWLREAASTGMPPAIDRLADLELSQLDGSGSIDGARELQQSLADQGYQRAAWEAAYLCAQAPDVDGAEVATAFLRACALGYPPAYFSLGLRFASGDGVGRDPELGWALLRRAADGGFAGAAEAAAALCPGFETRDEALRLHAAFKANLVDAHTLLGQLRPGIPGPGRAVHPLVLRVESHLAQVRHPAIGTDDAGRLCIRAQAAPRSVGNTSWTWLSQAPRVATCSGFATLEECAHLINKVATALRPASEYRRGNSANEDAELESFSGRGHPIGALHTDAVTRMLERKVVVMTGRSMRKLEPCSIVCYRPGEEYRPHVDFFSDEQILINRRSRSDFGGQRVATFLLYLRAPDAGGETSYPRAGVEVAGESGMAVIHYNVTPDGRQDHASLHAGRPIVRGEKWLWRSTLRAHSLYDPEDA
jgi:prolyl 4-hydroxylase